MNGCVESGREHLTVSEHFAPQAWEAYVAGHPDASLYHLHAWKDLIEAVFGKPGHYLAALDRAGTMRGVLPLVRLKSRIFGHYLVSMPYFNYGGVLADSPAAASALVDSAAHLAQTFGCHHVELRHTQNFLGLPVRTDKVSMVLDLPESDDALLASLKAKVRSQIRRPMREGATTDIGGVELLDEFYPVFTRNMRDLGTPVYPRKFFRAVLRARPDGKLVIVRLGGKPAAAGLLLPFRETVEIPWASSLREANRFGVNMLLYFAAMQWSIAAGYERFDFGRCTVDSGTYRFKKQWGAEAQQLYWHYCLQPGTELPRMNHDNPRFELAIRLWQRLPVPIANVLGPMLIKNLP